MTQGLAFLFSMLIEGAVAALLGAALHRHFNLPRLGASVRVGAAAVIATGATHPVVWLEFSGLLEWTGTWWGAAILSVAAVALVETLFYTAALRGYWRWSFTLSAAANVVVFCAGLLFASWLPRSA